MPRFAANLTLLFNDVPLLDRFEAALEAGFGGVELLNPYGTRTSDLRQALIATAQTLVLINTPTDWAAGARGTAALPGQQEQFRDDFRRALRLADVLGAQHIHVMAGLAQGDNAHDTFIDNLSWAARIAPEQPLTIEPINPVDMPGYFLNDFDQAARILDAVGAPNLALQFDAYHAHVITGGVGRTWAKYGHRATHVQVAGAEGRHEPFNGAIDYRAFFAQLDAEGYAGFVSGEYFPAGLTRDGLDWIR